MLVEEKNYTSTSQNGLQHSNIFIDRLNQTIRYARILCPSKYKEVVEKYVTLRRNVEHRVVCQNDNYEDDNYDDSALQKKRGKKEDVDTDYMERFYRFFLGSEVNANANGRLQWIQ